jgi:hypothetical protein
MLPDCRRCGAKPQIARDDTIASGSVSWAIHCSNEDCYNDTHWQNSMMAAMRIWQRNPCHYERGGQGSATDDATVH